MTTIKKILALSITLAFVAPTLAKDEGFYATALLGASQQINEPAAYGNNIAVDADFPSMFDADNGTVGGIGIGYKFNNQFRVEGRIGYHDSSYDSQRFGTGARDGEEYILKGKVENTTYTIEGFYDFSNNTSFTPYIKAGIGLSDNSFSAKLGGAGVAAFDAFDGAVDGYYGNYADGDSSEFSWNAGIGVNYQLTEVTSVYAEYQYASFGDVSTGQDAFTDGFMIDDVATNEFAIGIRVKL